MRPMLKLASLNLLGGGTEKQAGIKMEDGPIRG